MQEKIITLKTAQLAKEKEFNWSTPDYYGKYLGVANDYTSQSGGYDTERIVTNNWNDGWGSYPTRSEDVECSAPTQSLLQKWLREIHHIHITIEMVSIVSETYCYIIRGNFPLINSYKDLDYEDTYESALEDALEKALNLIYK